MRNLITKKDKHLIWQDECRDTFLILKHCEVYRYSDNTLRLLIWSPKFALQLRSVIHIFNDWRTDDGLVLFDTFVQNLPYIIAQGRFKRRPNIKGKFIKSKEELLAHKILPFRGVLND